MMLEDVHAGMQQIVSLDLLQAIPYRCLPLCSSPLACWQSRWWQQVGRCTRPGSVDSAVHQVAHGPAKHEGRHIAGVQQCFEVVGG